MNCDCVSKVNEKLREQFEDVQASVATVLTIEGNKLNAYPALSASYRPKKKDGSYKANKTISLRPSFCPFCGVKYGDSK